MQIIELYIKGYNRLEGAAQGTTTANLLTDSQATFTTTVSVGDLVENLTTQESSYVVSITNDTNVVLSESIFPDASLTYEYRITSPYFRADLFKDESISITETLLNVKDIGKVFTPFSQQFNLPASKLNNKLFRHYENQDILNSFDARYRHDAIIKLNGIDYKKGKIQFKSVSLKDNKPHAYKVVFFGDTVELKEILGETTLGGLDYGTDLNFEYTQDNITDLFCSTDSYIQSTFGSTDILVPNIQHSKNMRYSTANGYKDAITDTGLLWTDLKPAIRLKAIIEAIERKFPRIKFAQGFFNSPRFTEYYMWLHRNEGYVTNAIEGGGTRILRNRWYDLSVPDYTFTSGTELRPASFTPPPNGFVWQFRYRVEVNINVGGSTIPYSVRIRNASTEDEYYAHDYPDGGDSFTFATIPFSAGSGGFLDLMIEVESDSTIAMSQTLTVRLQRRGLSPNFSDVEVGTYTPINQSTENTFYINKQIPNIKVMDFLSGLFKMLNLLVFKDDDLIYVYEANQFMYLGEDYDITKYVDMSTSSVERLFQYKRMDFKFKSKKSFLVQFSDEIQGVPFAEEDYGDDEWDGGVYKVEVPFEKMMYERLSDESGNQTYIGQGAMLSKDFQPTIGEPLILCIAFQENTDEELTIDGIANSHYRRPTQLTTFAWGFSARQQLSFGEEKDEWFGIVPHQTTNLFENGYLDYVQTVFDRRSRLVKVTAYLPLSLLIKLKMNDTLVINNKTYKINSIKTNLLTNKSDLELYNVDEWPSQINNGQVAYLDRVAQVTSPSKTSTAINLSWTAVTGVVGYDIILNGGVFGTTVGTSVKVTPLEPDTTYTLGVRAKYNIDGNDVYSFDTSIIVTTDPPPVALAEDGDTLITEVGDTIILE